MSEETIDCNSISLLKFDMFTGLLEESCSIIYGFQEEKAPTSEVSAVFNVSHSQQEEKSIDTASTRTEKTCSLVGPHPGSGLQPLGEGECQSKVRLILNFRCKITLCCINFW